MSHIKVSVSAEKAAGDIGCDAPGGTQELPSTYLSPLLAFFSLTLELSRQTLFSRAPQSFMEKSPVVDKNSADI